MTGGIIYWAEINAIDLPFQTTEDREGMASTSRNQRRNRHLARAGKTIGGIQVSNRKSRNFLAPITENTGAMPFTQKKQRKSQRLPIPRIAAPDVSEDRSGTCQNGAKSIFSHVKLIEASNLFTVTLIFSRISLKFEMHLPSSPLLHMITVVRLYAPKVLHRNLT